MDLTWIESALALNAQFELEWSLACKILITIRALHLGSSSLCLGRFFEKKWRDRLKTDPRLASQGVLAELGRWFEESGQRNGNNVGCGTVSRPRRSLRLVSGAQRI